MLRGWRLPKTKYYLFGFGFQFLSGGTSRLNIEGAGDCKTNSDKLILSRVVGRIPNFLIL